MSAQKRSEPARLGQRTRHQLPHQLVAEGRGVEAVGKAVALPPIGPAGGAGRRRHGRQRGRRAGGEAVGGQAVAAHAGSGAGRRGHVGVGVLRGMLGLVLERGIEVHHGETPIARQRRGQLGVEGLHPAIEQRLRLGRGRRAVGGGNRCQHHAELGRERHAGHVQHGHARRALVQRLRLDRGRELGGQRLHVGAACLGHAGGAAREQAVHGGGVQHRAQQGRVGLAAVP